MLDFMRKRANSWLMVAVIGVIIFVFGINFGPWAGQQGGGENYSAKVNGEPLSIAAYRLAYANQFEMMKRFRPDYDADRARKDGLPQMVLQQLVSTALLAQEGENLGFIIDDESLALAVKQRIFGKDRPFDQEEYKRIVNGVLQTTEVQLEKQIRREIMAEKMAQVLGAVSLISDDELWISYKGQNEKVSLNYLKVDPSHFKAKKVSKEVDVGAWALDHEIEIARYYQRNLAKYQGKKQVQARHILIKSPKDATEAERKKAVSKAIKARYRVMVKGEDFAKVAKAVSEDSSAKKGGDLGFFSAGMMVPPFESQAFKMKKGEVSELVETQFGFHIIKVEDIKPSFNKTLESQKIAIAQNLIREEGQQKAAKEFADLALEKIKKGASLKTIKAANKRLKLTLQKTPQVTGDYAYIPGIGSAKEIVSQAINFKGKGTFQQEVFKSGDSFFIFSIAEKVTADKKKFETAKEKFKTQQEYRLKQRLMQAQLKEIRDRSSVELNERLFSGRAS